MAAEVLKQLNLSQGSLGEYLLAEDIGDLLHGDTLAGLDVGRGAKGGGNPVSLDGLQAMGDTTYQTMP